MLVKSRETTLKDLFYPGFRVTTTTTTRTCYFLLLRFRGARTPRVNVLLVTTLVITLVITSVICMDEHTNGNCNKKATILFISIDLHFQMKLNNW